jgi:fructose-specific phosphotransferase system IIC component
VEHLAPLRLSKGIALIYRLDEKYLIPRSCSRVTLSFAIALLGITAIGLILWALSGSDVSDILQNLPKPLSILFGLCGAYAAIGGLFLYVLMWIYLIAFDRTSPLARVGWVFALIFTLQYGALLYYFVVLTRIKPVSENLALAE